MAYSVNWLTKVVTIPQADLLHLTGMVYQLDMGEFHKEIRRLEWEFSEGLLWPEIIERDSSKLVGGILLAPVIIVINDYVVEFEEFAGSPYAVNLAGSNTNVADIAVVNNVSIRPQNSAGLINLDTLLSAAYGGEVVVDVLGGVDGTQTPIGTRATPSKNFTDANLIADKNSIRKFRLMRDSTIESGDFTDGHTFIGDNRHLVLTVLDAALMSNCAVQGLHVTGYLDGVNTLIDCDVQEIHSVSGYIQGCSFQGDVTLSGDTSIVNCYSSKAGSGYMNFITGDHEFQVSDWHRSLGIKGMTSGVHTIEMYGGQIHLDSTCTGGTIYLRGNYSSPPDDQSNGTTLIDQTDAQSVPSQQTADVHAAHMHRRTRDPATGVETIYEADKVTVRKQFNTADNGSQITEIDPV